jgi:nucleotide-binding universal stress UspA family protein
MPVPRPVADPDSGAPPLHRLLVAVDGSEGSDRALRLAARLARAMQSEVTLVHVGRLREDPVLAAEAERSADEEVGRRILAEAGRLLTAAGVPCRAELLHGRPADEIVRSARRHRAALVVLGTRGLTGARRILLGSVSHAVSAEAGCSVLLVR